MIGFEPIGRRAPAEPAVVLATPTSTGEDFCTITVGEPAYAITRARVDQLPNELRDAGEEREGEDDREPRAVRED